MLTVLMGGREGQREFKGTKSEMVLRGSGARGASITSVYTYVNVHTRTHTHNTHEGGKWES